MIWSRPSSKDYPSNPLPAVVFGLSIIFLGLGSIVAWSALVSISSAIVSSGTLKVSSNRKPVQTSEGGTVRKLSVQNGARVSAGDILVSLDDTKARSTLKVLQSNYDLVRATVARLRAEQRGFEEIVFPGDLLARKNDSEVADMLGAQRYFFNARKKAFAGQKSIIFARINRLYEEINGLIAQSSFKDEQVKIIQVEYQNLKTLLKKGLIQKSRMLALEREALRLKGEKRAHESGITRAEGQATEARLEILQYHKTFISEVSDQLTAKETEMFGLTERVMAAKYALEQTEIRATGSGIVVDLKIDTVGQVLQPGAVLLEIVPENDELIVEARIRPADIDNIAVGLNAEVVFSAFSRAQIPKLSGQVIYVSADILTDTRTSVSYYLAKVSVQKNDFFKSKPIKLLPGMPADVFIVTGERTPLSYLTQPLRDSMFRAWREP